MLRSNLFPLLPSAAFQTKNLRTIIIFGRRDSFGLCSTEHESLDPFELKLCGSSFFHAYETPSAPPDEKHSFRRELSSRREERRPPDETSPSLVTSNPPPSVEFTPGSPTQVFAGLCSAEIEPLRSLSYHVLPDDPVSKPPVPGSRPSDVTDPENFVLV